MSELQVPDRLDTVRQLRSAVRAIVAYLEAGGGVLGSTPLTIDGGRTVEEEIVYFESEYQAAEARLSTVESDVSGLSAGDVAVADTGLHYDAESVEGCLEELATEDIPASRISVADSGEYLDATDVEAALAELFVALQDLSAAISADTGGSAGVNCSVSDVVAGGMHKTTLTLTNVAITVNDGAVNNNQVIFTFPAGAIKIIGATSNFTVTNTLQFNADTADQYYYGVGTAVGSGDLTTTEQNVVAKQTCDTNSNTVSSFNKKTQQGTDATIDGTSTAVTLKLNVYIPAANDSGANTITFNGTLTFVWCNLGDY